MSNTPTTPDLSTAVALPSPQVQALQGAVNYASQQDPNHYEKLLQYQKLTGIPPEVALGNERQIKQQADINRVDPHLLSQTAPRTSAWFTSNPANAAVAGVDGLHSQAQIEQHAAGMRGPNDGWMAFKPEPSLWSEFKDALVDAFTHPTETLLGADTAQQAAAKQQLIADTARDQPNNQFFKSIQDVNQTLEKPLLNPSGTKVFQGLLNPKSRNVFSRSLTGATKSLEGLTTPNNIGLLASLPLAPEDAAPLASGVFSGQMAEGAASGGVQAAKSIYQGNYGDAAEQAVGAGASALFAVGAGKHALSERISAQLPAPLAPLPAVAPEFADTFRSSKFLSNVAGVVDASERSPLAKVSPDKFHEANQANFEGDPSYLISQPQFTEHMAGKGIDPASIATNYAEAVMSGGEVEVPRAGFHSLDPETQKALLPDVKNPEWDMTAREFQEGREDLQQFMQGGGLEKLSAQMDAADAETASSPDFQQIREQFRQQHIDAGETPEVADSLADTQASVYTNLARQVNMRPAELAALYNPKFVEGEAPEGATVLNQSSEDGPRGWYKENPDGTFEIGKTALGDESTKPHELAHLYLRMIADMAKREGASDVIKEDHQKVLDFIGAKDGEPFSKEHQEKFAKATERYLEEGKAPSRSLRGTFQRFAVWLGKIYQGRDLGAPLTDDIRGVFDRLYASEHGVDRAEAEAGPRLFNSPEEAGWTDEQFQKYADARGMGVEQAKAEIFAKLNEAALREKADAWQEEEKNVRAAVTENIDRSPSYTAIRSLRRGSLDDGTDLTLSRDELAKQFGEDRVKALQKQHPGLYRNEGGVDPEVAAEILGFDSAERMMQAVEASPRRSAAIDTTTREYMTAKHGDIRYDGSLQDKADLALANDQRAEALHKELEGLKRRNNPEFELREAQRDLQRYMREQAEDARQQRRVESRDQRIETLKQKVAALQETIRASKKERQQGNRIAKDIAPIAAYREAAHQMVEAKALSDLQPTRYLDASRKYSREAIEALAKGDYEEAQQAKHKELMNHFLYREATDAKEYVADSMKKFNRIFKPDKNLSKSRAVDLVNAARSILSAVGIGPSGRITVDAASFMDGVKNYNPELYAELKPAIDEAVSAGENGYRSMPVADFRTLRDQVDTLWARSLRDMQVFVDGRLKNREDVVTELNHRLNEIGPRKNQPGISSAVTTKDRAINSLYEAKAAFRRMEYWASSVDGMKGPGPFTKYIVRPVLNALTDYRMQREEPMKQLFGIISGFDAAKQKIEAPELGYTFGAANGGIGKYELLGAIAHTGNDSNMRKLLLGRKWGEKDAVGGVDTSRWDAFMKRMWAEGTITKPDMDGVQKIWDLNDSLKPIAQATYHSLFGYYFKEVKSSPMETPFGTYRGGYVPAKPDPFMVRDAQRNAKMEDLESDFKNSLPSTGMAFTHARVEYNEPLSLDLRVISKHIDDTLRFAMVQPAIRDVLSIMRDRSFSDQLGQLDPVAMESMMIPWLNRAARQITSEPGMLPFVDDFYNAVRSRVGTATMFGNLANSLVHIPNLSFSVLQTGVTPLLSSLAHYMRGPREMADDIIEQSSFMKTRLDLQSRKMQTSINNILDNKGPVAQSQQWFQEHGYFIQHAIWNLSDIITWHAAFNKALDEIGTSLDPDQAKAEAIERADATVRMTQGSDNPEDLARFQVGSPAYKAMIQFTSWFNSMGNLKLTEATKTIRDMGLKASAGRLFYIYAFGMAIPAMVSSGLVQLARGEFDPDEPILPQFLKWFFGSQAEFLTSEIPFGNFGLNAGKAAYQDATHKRQAFNDQLTSNPSLSALQSSTIGTVRATSDLFSSDKQVTGRDVRDLLTMLSLFTRYPVSALGRPAGYLTDVHRGTIVPTSTADAVRGTLTGSASEASRTHHSP